MAHSDPVASAPQSTSCPRCLELSDVYVCSDGRHADQRFQRATNAHVVCWLPMDALAAAQLVVEHLPEWSSVPVESVRVEASSDTEWFQTISSCSYTPRINLGRKLSWINCQI